MNEWCEALNMKLRKKLYYLQMPGGDRPVCGGQGPQKPVSGMSTEEVSTAGHEQGR